MNTHRDRRAAKRLLLLLLEQSQGEKTDDELCIEAWLWGVAGEPDMASVVRAAR
jgi:hypothetical protein